jgi:hypothetical protein
MFIMVSSLIMRRMFASVTLAFRITADAAPRIDYLCRDAAILGAA